MLSILWNFKIWGIVMRWDGNLGDKVTLFLSQVIVNRSLFYDIFSYNPLKKSANQWGGRYQNHNVNDIIMKARSFEDLDPSAMNYVGKCPGELVFLCSKNLSAASRTPSYKVVFSPSEATDITGLRFPLWWPHSWLLCEMFKVSQLGSWPPVKKTAKVEVKV